MTIKDLMSSIELQSEIQIKVWDEAKEGYTFDGLLYTKGANKYLDTEIRFIYPENGRIVTEITK